MDKAAGLALIRAGRCDIAPGRRYEVDFFRPDDALGVARLFEAIYGDKYPVDDYYIPERIAAGNASGDIITMLARTDTGDVVGQTAFTRTSSPNPHLYEAGQMIVLPAYRHGQVAPRLTALVHHCLATRAEIHGSFVEVVTNHLVTQKLAVRINFRCCGLELALMPEGALAGENAGQQRISCLLMANVLRDIRRELHLPAIYRDVLAPIVESLGIDRAMAWSDGVPPADEGSVIDVQRFAAAGVIRCHVSAIGPDLGARLAALAAERVPLLEVFLRADGAAAPWAVAVLCAQGFCLGGLLPLWFGADAILLQKLAVTPDFDAIRLLEDAARRLCEAVRADYHRVRP